MGINRQQTQSKKYCALIATQPSRTYTFKPSNLLYLKMQPTEQEISVRIVPKEKRKKSPEDELAKREEKKRQAELKELKRLKKIEKKMQNAKRAELAESKLRQPTSEELEQKAKVSAKLENMRSAAAAKKKTTFFQKKSNASGSFRQPNLIPLWGEVVAERADLTNFIIQRYILSVGTKYEPFWEHILGINSDRTSRMFYERGREALSSYLASKPN